MEVVKLEKTGMMSTNALTAEQYLLIQLIQELAELQQEVTKMLMFTPHHVCRTCAVSNNMRANNEYNDVIGLVEMLRDMSSGLHYDPKRIQAKKEKVLYYMREHAIPLGTLLSIPEGVLRNVGDN
jgi:hypothetical protein